MIFAVIIYMPKKSGRERHIIKILTSKEKYDNIESNTKSILIFY